MCENRAQWAKNVDVLAEFLGVRDVPELTQSALRKKYGFAQADVMVLFGGSILCGGDVLAQAMKEQAARKYIIVGGEGHTTQSLRDFVHALYPAIETDGLPEAQVYAKYLRHVHGLKADALECSSTNCGNNITNLLALMKEKGIACKSIILVQDATMQRRMAAGLRRHAPEILPISFASYSVRYTNEPAELPLGMWDDERYTTLLLGEIPRLRDDADGYGPAGKGFIAHEEIPAEVEEAFAQLSKTAAVRDANPLYAG